MVCVVVDAVFDVVDAAYFVLFQAVDSNLDDERVSLGGELLRGHVDESDADEEVDERIVGTLLQRSHVLAQRMFVRSRHQRVVPVQNSQRQMIRPFEHEAQAEPVVPKILGNGDDLAEEIPRAEIVDVLDAYFLDEIVGEMSVFVENTGDEANKLGLLGFGALFHEIGSHQSGDREAFQLLVVFLVHQCVADLGKEGPKN